MQNRFTFSPVIILTVTAFWSGSAEAQNSSLFQRPLRNSPQFSSAQSAPVPSTAPIPGHFVGTQSNGSGSRAPANAPQSGSGTRDNLSTQNPGSGTRNPGSGTRNPGSGTRESGSSSRNLNTTNASPGSGTRGSGTRGSGTRENSALPPAIAGASPQLPGTGYLPYSDPSDANTLNNLSQASWTYAPPPSPRQLRVHDIVNIRVDDAAQTTAQGNAASRKNGLYDAVLLDWVRLSGLLTLKPSEQNDGDPRVQGQSNEVYRADSTLRTRESIVFNIASEITDIRPNGNLVLTAQKSITHNDNTYELSLSGICRPQDIGPDNVVLSEHILDLRIHKLDQGHVRDGYSRGWFTRLLARFKPF